MTSRLDILKGAIVENVVFTEDYFQIKFQNGYILNVYNDYAVTVDFSKLLYQMVSAIDERQNTVRILFKKDCICIDLSSRAYHGPEALQLSDPNGETLVWN